MDSKRNSRVFAVGAAGALLLFALAGAAAFLLTGNRRKASKPVLYVTAYSSFLSLYGPGRFLKEDFENLCGCRVRYIKAEDSAGLLQRAALPVKQDLIIGLDQLSLAEAAAADPALFEEIPLSREERGRFIPEMKNVLSPCLPFNYAPAGWIVRKDGRRGRGLTPESFLDLLREEKISFPDPRTSSLGLLLLYWLENSFRGDRKALKAFLQRLKPKVYGGSLPSWSLSYGFFQKGRVQVSLSYLTSLAYHIIEEGSSDYRFALFKGGHPRQTEFACVLRKSRKKALSNRFVKYLLSRKAQGLIMRRNYMFPTVKDVFNRKTPEILHDGVFTQTKNIIKGEAPDILHDGMFSQTKNILEGQAAEAPHEGMFSQTKNKEGVFESLPIPPPLDESWLDESWLDESPWPKEGAEGGLKQQPLPAGAGAPSASGGGAGGGGGQAARKAPSRQNHRMTQKNLARFIQNKKELLKLWKEAMD